MRRIARERLEIARTALRTQGRRLTATPRVHSKLEAESHGMRHRLAQTPPGDSAASAMAGPRRDRAEP